MGKIEDMYQPLLLKFRQRAGFIKLDSLFQLGKCT